MDVRRRTSGFTLLEILIVIAIIGILASIGYPSYQQYIVKANRAAAQQFLLEAASVQQQYLLANNGNGYAIPRRAYRTRCIAQSRQVVCYLLHHY